MNWNSFIQHFNLALGIVLIVRLFSIHLQKAYKFFCGYLIADLIGSAAWVLYQPFEVISYDSYWRIWLIVVPVIWAFTLLTTYFLLTKILVQLPGLLRLSRRVLHVIFLSALIIGLASARYEYKGPGVLGFFKGGPGAFKEGQFLIQCWTLELIVHRAIASAALLSLVGIIMFLLWFPVTIPRNLAIFSVGFTIYFAAVTCLLLLRSFWPDDAVQDLIKITHAVSFLLSGVSGACYAFWLVYLSPEGETAVSRLSIQRPPQEQQRLIAQLELINEALVKTIHH